MNVTIYSIVNGMLWGGIGSLALSGLSRSRRFLCRVGIEPLVVLAWAWLVRCCLPIEISATKEIGSTALNGVHQLMADISGAVVPEPWFFRLWVVGAAVSFTLWLPGYIYKLFAVRKLANTQDSRVQRFRTQNNVPGLRVVISPRVEAPCALGLWRETILLPDTGYTAKQLSLILQHEYCHIKHHDGLLDFLLRILCTLYWWNPGVHVCRLVIMRLCDHRCDGDCVQPVPAAKFFCTTSLKRQWLVRNRATAFTTSTGFCFPTEQDSLPVAQSPKDV